MVRVQIVLLTFEGPPKRFHWAVIDTGMRKGEMLGAAWRYLNLEEDYLSIAQALNKKGAIVPRPKTKASCRSIDLPDEVIIALIKHKAYIIEQKRIAGELYHDLDLINCTAIGKKSITVM